MMEEKKVVVEPPSDDPRQKVVMHTVASLVYEVGFSQVDKSALEALMEMLETHIMELGRKARTYAEAACRIEPTAGDVSMAMIDLGQRIDAVGLRSYARRHTRPITPNPQGLAAPRIPQILSAGKRRSLPPHIPEYYPPMPDPHSYIRTPTHKQPFTDYAACRERMSQQKRDLERSLSKFYARTSPCFYFFPDNKDLFPLMLPKPVTYLNAVICRDQIFEEEQSLPPINVIKREKRPEQFPKLSEEDENGTEGQGGGWELIDNPFLRSPRPAIPMKKPG